MKRKPHFFFSLNQWLVSCQNSDLNEITRCLFCYSVDHGTIDVWNMWNYYIHQYELIYIKCLFYLKKINKKIVNNVTLIFNSRKLNIIRNSFDKINLLNFTVGTLSFREKVLNFDKKKKVIIIGYPQLFITNNERKPYKINTIHQYRESIVLFARTNKSPGSMKELRTKIIGPLYINALFLTCRIYIYV